MRSEQSWISMRWFILKTEDNRRADEILQEEEGMHALTSDEVHARLYS